MNCSYNLDDFDRDVLIGSLIVYKQALELAPSFDLVNRNKVFDRIDVLLEILK